MAQLEQWAAEGQVDGWGVKQVRVLDIVQQDADTGENQGTILLTSVINIGSSYTNKRLLS